MAPARGSFHQTKRAFGYEENTALTYMRDHACNQRPKMADDMLIGRGRGERLLAVSDLSVGVNIVSWRIFSLLWVSFSPPVGQLVG